MNSQILDTTLTALRRAGSVFGVLFHEGEQQLFSDLAYTPDRIEEFTGILDDISHYFEQESRAPEALSFSYDGGNIVVLLRGALRLVVLHHNADEADFIATAGEAFLKDYRNSRRVKSFIVDRKKLVAAGAIEKKVVDPTAPIAPAGA